MHAQNCSKMQEEKKFVGSLANRAQANNKEKAKSTNGDNPSLGEFRVKGSWFHAKGW